MIHFWSLTGMMTMWFVFKNAPSKPVFSGSEATQANREDVQSQLESFHWCVSFIYCLVYLNSKSELKSLCWKSHYITKTQGKYNLISSSLALSARIVVKGRAGTLRVPVVALGSSLLPSFLSLVGVNCANHIVGNDELPGVAIHEQTMTALALAVCCHCSAQLPKTSHGMRSTQSTWWTEGKMNKPSKVRLQQKGEEKEEEFLS